jgi:hypothetical protein
MSLVEEPKMYDLFSPEALLNPYPRYNRVHPEDLVDFTESYDIRVGNAMVNCERIAAVAAELARQFWLEIEGEFAQQSAMPSYEETWPGWSARPADPADWPAALRGGPPTHAPMETHAIDYGQIGPFAIPHHRGRRD